MPLFTLQVTIGASVTQVSTTSIPVKQVTVQNNAAHSCRVGDKLVTSSRGILLSSGSPGGSVNEAGWSGANVDLQEIWIAGTQNDVIDLLYVG